MRTWFIACVEHCDPEDVLLYRAMVKVCTQTHACTCHAVVCDACEPHKKLPYTLLWCNLAVQEVCRTC